MPDLDFDSRTLVSCACNAHAQRTWLQLRCVNSAWLPDIAAEPVENAAVLQHNLCPQESEAGARQAGRRWKAKASQCNGTERTETAQKACTQCPIQWYPEQIPCFLCCLLD